MIRQATVAVCILLGMHGFLLTPGASAQRLTGAIVGVVTDSTDLHLPGVTVEIVSPTLIGGPQSVVTDERGAFRFAALAPGAYELIATLPGFQTHRRQGLTVTLGGTVTYDVVMSVGGLEETISVRGGVPLIDVASSSAATNLDMGVLDEVPLGRIGWLHALATAPGISLTTPMVASNVSGTGGATNIMAFGSPTASNAYRIDGIDASDSDLGGARIQPVPGIFEDLQVMGIGAPAEYGPFLGAVTNVVTKSGGNTLAGQTMFVHQSDTLTAENGGNTSSFHRDRYHDWASHLGGPLVRNTLWFFGAYQYLRDSYSVYGGDPASPSLQKTDRYFGKLTWAPNARHQVFFSFHNEINKNQGLLGAGDAPETQTVKDRNYPAPSLQWRWALSSNTYLQAGYAGWFMEDSSLPADGCFSCPEIQDIGLSTTYGGAGYVYRWRLSRNQLKADIGHYIDRAAGRHDLRFGYQWNRGYSNAPDGNTGGWSYTYEFGVPVSASFALPNWYGGVGRNWALFVDDNWSPTERLTVNLGLRYDRQQADILGANRLDIDWNETDEFIEGVKDALVWRNLSPRVGLVYQLGDDRRTALKLNYSRYTDSLKQSHVIGFAPTLSISYDYEWNPSAQDWDLIQTTIPNIDSSLDPNMRAPKTNQYSVSLERQFGDALAASVTGVYKDTWDLPARINTLAEWEPVEYYDAIGNQTIQVWNQVNVDEDHFLATNVDFFRQYYRGLIMTLTKRPSNRWHATSSLTLSRADGVAGGTSFTTNLGNLNSLVNNSGPLNGDRTVMLKVLGGVTLPAGVNVAANYTHQTGSPFARTVRVTGLNQGPQTVAAGPRGSLRYPSDDALDVRAEKVFSLGGVTRAKVTLDVFNLLNSDTTLAVRSTLGTAATYLLPSSIVQPRIAQVSFGLTF